MEIADVKKNLNKMVLFSLYDTEKEWLFVGCTLRKRGAEFYYQAELKEVEANAVIIARLEDVKPIGG